MFVELQQISKSYFGNPVLKKVNFIIRAGQVHALVGENGAGKSTLMKILIGVEKAESGTILINNETRTWLDPSAAREAGIVMVYQELSLIPTLTVFENVFLGRLLKNRYHFVDWSEMKRQVRQIFAEIEFPIDIEKIVEELSIAEKQMVEIARALAQNAELIILDEPTSPLTKKDAERLFERIKILQQKGVSIVYITHRLEEVFSIADVITILRDGKLIRTCPIDNIDMQAVVRDMVGREISEQFPPKADTFKKNNREPVLVVENAGREKEFSRVSFQLHAGEILGIAGLVGAGRTELVESIFGVTKIDQGKIIINQNAVKINSPADAVNNGLGLIADDRKIKGLVPEAAIDFNLSMATQWKFATRWGWRIQSQEKKAAENMMDKLRVKFHSLQQHASRLSGGNQQKIAIGKSLNSDADILIFDEPTRGIDVGAKREIYFLLRQLADEGAAIILVSSELEEILGLSDRILVMHQGRIAGQLNSHEANQEKIMQLAVGLNEST